MTVSVETSDVPGLHAIITGTRNVWAHVIKADMPKAFWEGKRWEESYLPGKRWVVIGYLCKETAMVYITHAFPGTTNEQLEAWAYESLVKSRLV